MFLRIQLQSGVKRNAVWNGLRGSEQVDEMDVCFSVSLQMWVWKYSFSKDLNVIYSNYILIKGRFIKSFKTRFELTQVGGWIGVSVKSNH